MNVNIDKDMGMDMVKVKAKVKPQVSRGHGDCIQRWAPMFFTPHVVRKRFPMATTGPLRRGC